jgi:hypothetical protein
MKEHSQKRHYSEKGGHFKRGEFRRQEIKALKTEAKLRRRGEEPIPVFTKLVGSDIFLYEQYVADKF